MPTLEWIGKDKVINHHQEVPFRILDKKYTYNAESSENMIIHGDNLLALKSLLPQYEGKVDCIYIDPPYNTGNEKWVYNDNVNDPKIKKWLGEVVGQEGEDLSRHDKWLCMMYPRLTLLHKFLSPKGVILISIDSNELDNLRIICDEIFGRSNFVDIIVWNKKSGAKGVPPKNMIVNVHEYILVYQRTDQFRFQGELRNAEKEGFKNPDNDPRGPWRMSNIKSTTKPIEDAFTIIDPNTGKEYKNTWAFSKESLEKMIAEGRILWKETLPKQKEFFYELTNESKAIKSSWGVFDPQSTTVFLKQVLPTIKFDNPKPISMLDYLMEVSTNKDSIILDSFAGSGTTAHAVLDLNKQDGGNRKFILVEMMDYADTITAERVKRVIDGYGEGNKAVEGLGGDFSYYELGAPLFKEDKNLNEEVGEEEIRKYVYYMETKKPIETNSTDNRYYMGKNNDTAYYFYYEKDKPTTLNRDFLATVKTEATGYVIYADICALSKETLSANGIVFKKIPRDIKRL
ncbi:MAG: site-specific DNA-methyltransferase [Christensenellales bacterium]